jgi:DNA-binding FadR family transcriptional regulator
LIKNATNTATEDHAGILRSGLSTDQAMRAITEMITSGQLQPGDRMPTERVLADKLGLSRNTVREAVRALELMRVLDVRQGDGTYVTSLEPMLLYQATEFVTRLLTEDRLVEVFEVRRILESAASAAAAARMSDADVAELGNLVERIGAATTPVELLEADLAFHNFIADHAGNDLLAALVRAFSARTYRARLWRSRPTDSAWMKGMKDFHARIYKAIAARSPMAAQTIAAYHIEATIADVQGLTEDGDSEDAAR